MRISHTTLIVRIKSMVCFCTLIGFDLFKVRRPIIVRIIFYVNNKPGKQDCYGLCPFPALKGTLSDENAKINHESSRKLDSM